jgi:choline dehydrogenase
VNTTELATGETSNRVTNPDYVIVGGGTAGCVLAARLSEDPSCEVLLIEAGPGVTGGPISDPARWLELGSGPFDWGYSYAGSPGVGGRAIPIPRGRVIGGSSAINALLWYRGHPSDYDDWEQRGAKGWNYANLLPYFRRSEDWQGGATEQRGAGGPMRIETSPEPHPIATALLGAAAELGLPVLEDPNGPSNSGAGYANLMVSAGRRCSAAVGYLGPARGRPNLEIRCDSLVIGLLFSGDTCVGVRHVVDGQVREAFADAEVIVCLGAFDSPKLLLRSGIGPASQLARLGVQTRMDLPGVGENLRDHPLLAGITFRAKAPLGPVRDNGGGSMLNWRSSNAALPDLHAFVVQGRHADDHLAAKYGLDGDVFAIGPGLMRSASVGRLRMTSTDSFELQPNFLAEPADVAALAEAIDTVLDLALTGPYRELTSGPLMPAGRLDAQAKREYLRATCSTFFHAAGTCAIGPVLSAELAVHGVERLRVVDASVFPSLPSCNTTAPVIAVAERAADLIRGATP